MTRIQQFGSTVLIAVAFLPLVPCSGSAQQLTDAQAQALIQSLAAQQSAVVAGGNTTITLTDNTQITFLGVSSAGALSGHIMSS